MSSSAPVPLGRHLLDRRVFLAHMATGVGGIALSAMLAERRLLAAWLWPLTPNGRGRNRPGSA